ncbi:tRNA (adenosine(37)-N6)-threonylcarbamoyltransferase complex ATPase subunit type 1 TsaE [Clostridia bacterium]|nr:tRNA (adenosine(37)-N6)-threonylcarbamoyltransferase complex ATPase subunit type 1 TsaE [Clostridia bacterium]
MVKESYSSQETLLWAKEFGEKAKQGEIYCLTGDLGVGKTLFCQGFIQGLGVEEIVNSPTFTIVQVYQGKKFPVFHFDVYRIHSDEEMFDLGYEEYFFGEGICLIEWAEQIFDVLPDSCVWISINKEESKGDFYRKITIETHSEKRNQRKGEE